MGDDVRSHTCEIGSGFIDVFLVDADGQIAFLVDTVVGTGDLGKTSYKKSIAKSEKEKGKT